ncbi:MAG: flagellar protein [Clostridiales bacterium]|nr:flagellar protein [Clostridiales bacterium]
MDVRNCRNCGKLFNYIHGPHLCPTCVKALDDKFEEVKEYVYDHPRVDMQEVSEVFDISISQIKQWIREERLSFAEDSMIGLDCESCGVTIKMGRYCKSCKDKLAKGFQELYHKPEPLPKQKPTDHRYSGRMRFLDQDRN